MLRMDVSTNFSREQKLIKTTMGLYVEMLNSEDIMIMVL